MGRNEAVCAVFDGLQAFSEFGFSEKLMKKEISDTINLEAD